MDGVPMNNNYKLPNSLKIEFLEENKYDQCRDLFKKHKLL